MRLSLTVPSFSLPLPWPRPLLRPLTLTLTLLLTSLATASIFEDHGYTIKTAGDIHAIFSSRYYCMTEFLNVMSFYPEMKMASIYIANNEEEPDHEDKLSLTEIYIALAGMKNLEPNDMKAVIFDVDEDEETVRIIKNIRRDRNLGPLETVSILPGDKEWDTICGTQYYLKLLQVMSKPVQKIILMNREYAVGWSETGTTYRIVFSSPESQPREENLASKVWGAVIKAIFTTDGLAADSNQEEEAALKALLAEEEWKKLAFNSKIGIELASQALAVIRDCDTSQLWA